MENINPTRMNLLQRRSQVNLAIQGVELLRRKRDALVANFFEVARLASEKRNQLESSSQRAYHDLALGKVYTNPERLKFLEVTSAREITSEIEVRNVWGVKIPEIKSPFLKREVWDRGWNPSFTNIFITRATGEFEELIETLISLANEQIKIERLGEEIKKTTRRVNALEQIVIPQTKSEIAFIKSVLEEREREDTFRLKRLKKKRAG